MTYKRRKKAPICSGLKFIKLLKVRFIVYFSPALILLYSIQKFPKSIVRMLYNEGKKTFCFRLLIYIISK